jgi:hypothetical protein
MKVETAASKKRYRVHRGEPGQDVEMRGINLKKDFYQGKASEECPWKRFEDKRIRPGRPCSDSFCPEQYCVRSVLQANISPHRDIEWRRGREFVVWKDPARLSSLSAVMESIQHNRRLWGDFYSPTDTTFSILKWRSRLSIRLHLLWLNFLLIPTRIHYMLWHINRGPYGKSIITNRGEDQ